MPFSPETLDFLFINHMNNSRSWFREHKDEYKKYVLEPLAELVERLTPTMLEIDGALICAPRVGGSISRIYRDLRFSKDKSLYRANMWILFIRDKRLYNGLPAYYFDVSPDGLSYGCGYYTTSNDSLAAMRKLILNGDRSFKRALAAYEKQDVFTLEGTLYKRSRFPQAGERERSWLDRRDIGLIRNSGDFELLFSDGLWKVLAEDFKKIVPVYEFFMKAESSVLREQEKGRA